uniref:glycogenin glucosyltransferase n=1 Tax=Photinus pyralis TaxID=7054 RepID=A0A1Y1LKY7_PHOPY
MGGFAWVTLATNDSYSLGALVLAHSLRQVNTVHQLAVLVTPGVTPVMRAKLASVFNVVVEVNILDSKDEANLRLLKRPELGVTFTKLHCWRLTQFEKCVFLDADTMVLANADELFDKEEFSAAPDVGWPDCFNSGVFVYRPSEETYSNIVKFALERGSFDGGDQGLLNLYFSDWAHKDISKHLPFIYNTCSTACYSYLPAFKQFGGNVKIIHFIGSSKPWLQYFDSETRQVQVGSDLQHLRVVLQQWWNIFCSCIHPILSPEMAPSRVPAAIPLPFHSSMEQTVHHEFNPDSSYNKPTSKNVWDPWEEYEEKIDNFEIQSNTICVPNVHSENIDTSVHIASEIHDNNNIPTFQHSQETPESSHFLHHDTNTHMLHNVSHNQESHVDTFVNQPEFSFSNQSDHTPPPHPLHDSVHSHIEQSFQPPSPEPDICTSYTNVEPGTECTQHARPQSCESASSVTNESALHESNEVFDNSAGLAGAFARLTLGAPRTAEQAMLEDQLRRQGWEVGNIDYMGRDSFDNIWTKICETLNTAPAPPDQSQEPSHAVPSEAAKQGQSNMATKMLPLKQ